MMHKACRIISVISIAMLFVGTSAAESEKTVTEKTFSLAQLQNDFNELYAQIMSKHAFLFAKRQDVEKKAGAHMQLLREGMTELEFYRILSPIVSDLNCGHSYLSLSKESLDFIGKDARVFPLSLKILDNRAFVLKDPLNAGIAPGTEIAEINGKPIAGIVETMLKSITSDGSNTTRKLFQINRNFSRMYYQYIDAAQTFNVLCGGPADRKKIKKTVKAVRAGDYYNAISQSAPADPDSGKIYYGSFHDGYALLKIRSFNFRDNSSISSFKSFVDDYFKELKDKGISSLILDLRDNGGGNSVCSSYLFSYLTSKAHPYFVKNTPGFRDLTFPVDPARNRFSGKLYTLINGGCFSSTGRLSAMLKFLRIGVFIGEETGGSYVCTDGSKDVVLANTGILLHYSTQVYESDAPGLTFGRGIMPDHPVRYTIKDIIDGKDLEKSLALNLIGEKNKR